jgi:two-component system heavy metal sensor histidine kinase CusS
LAVWYAIAATLTLACLSVAGHFVLRKDLIHGLDLLNTAEFRQIEANLGPNYMKAGPSAIDGRIRETTRFASVLFYTHIQDQRGSTLFNSDNLRDQTLPNIPGGREFDIDVDKIGELRAARFVLEPYTLIIATPLKPVRDLLRGYTQISIALVAIMMTVSIAIGFGLSHFALRPVYVIEETANRIRSDNLSERIPVDNIDYEVANLATLLNQMFDRLEASFNQTRRFTGEASHELKTPLSLIRLQGERMLVEGGLSQAHEEAVQLLLEEVTRLNKIIDELLLISRAEAGAIILEHKPQQPGEFLQSFAQDARALVEYQGMRYYDFHQGEGSISFDPKWMRQVLLNLLTNALKAGHANSTVTIRSALSSTGWRVSVEDEGKGVPPEALARIFERFVRLGSSGTEGTGLGLAICRSIVELHKGHIWAEVSDPGKGLCIVFELPLSDVKNDSVTTTATKAHHGFPWWDPRVIWSSSRRHQERYTD